MSKRSLEGIHRILHIVCNTQIHLFDPTLRTQDEHMYVHIHRHAKRNVEIATHYTIHADHNIYNTIAEQDLTQVSTTPGRDIN